MPLQSHSPVMDAASATSVTGEFIPILGETYYRIAHYDRMPPFFVTVVSSDDHWLFVATTGGLTAGRVNADHALFPYYTVDRLIENADNTGSKTLIRVPHADGETSLWEPFIPRHYSPYTLERYLYKNIPGTSLVFEEVNVDLGLTFRYAWRTSAAYGVVKTAWLENRSDKALTLTITDGVQNVLPAHVDSFTQNALSVLLDAYKRAELDNDTGLGIYSLSSRLTDLAEPSESLRANTIWQTGLDAPVVLMSSQQLETIRAENTSQTETDVRGKRGAYFVHSDVTLTPNETRSWHFVAEVNQDGAAVADLARWLQDTPDKYTVVADDIAASSDRLKRIVASADGVQVSGDRMGAEHHFANVLFNVMRGGTFANGYTVEKADFAAYVRTHDKALIEQHADFFAGLPEAFTIATLHEHAEAQQNTSLARLCTTYLPLTFSRRHGDPSRPWNRFTIHLKNADGSPRLSYEGNWRDIFQNWEALAFAYPETVESMISVFLNATTLDGYNPYRINRDGIDWEIPEPDNPWANIGYWSDHQIIYLQKLMEASERFHPGKLRDLLDRPAFASADVPYRIHDYADIVQDPYNTIDFDTDAQQAIEERVARHGTDGRLVFGADGDVLHTTLAEKLLNLLLAKLVNFVPGGGIWMNTQRPEWNDANNALVGKGLSVVTTCYLRRYIAFFRRMLASAPDELALTSELHALFVSIRNAFKTHPSDPATITDEQRRTFLDTLGAAGGTYRRSCYAGFPGKTATVNRDDLSAFLADVQAIIEQTITASRRDDGLYHAYNTLSLDTNSARVGHLQTMLEGQVAVLSSGMLPPDEVVTLLNALRESDLYRADQHTYILYPDRELPSFLEKNTLDESQIAGIKLVQILIDRHDPRLIVRDTDGGYHFGGELRNDRDMRALLDELANDPALASLVEAESDAIVTLFEQTFRHEQFTGRSGSFFAYEGLGSIYWHMVSKLLLAVQENVYQAASENSKQLSVLIDAYYDIRAGLGFNKSPEVYGAFPLDPYSHTPRDAGAKQPGMTGMVKEEVLTRLGEIGFTITDGTITFDPVLLRDEEFLNEATTLHTWGVDDKPLHISVAVGSFALTLCRVPFVVRQSDTNEITLHLADGTQRIFSGLSLDTEISGHIFAHDGLVQRVDVCYKGHAT